MLPFNNILPLTVKTLPEPKVPVVMVLAEIPPDAADVTVIPLLVITTSDPEV
jgi:hypothetical protein